jgi:UDP-GlcNAc:undecaprenyl-phosphate GlcNAc-1-phosphate transferase
MGACLVNHQWFIAATLALLIGAVGGFLVFNFPPATIFMGDRGSLVIGFVLAVLTVRTTYLHPELGGGWYGVFMPLVVLAIPLYDFTTVTVIRLRQGRSPFVGDQQHFSHRLVRRGLSTRGAVVVIWAATAVTGIGGVALGSLQAWQAVLVGAQTVLVLAVLALLEHASRGAVAGKHGS